MEEEEIDLSDYFKVIFKRKFLISIIFLVSVIGAAIFSFLSPKVYKIDTVLSIGNIAGTLIERPDEIINQVEKEVFSKQIRLKENIPIEQWPKIKIENLNKTNLIYIFIESHNTNLAKKILSSLGKMIEKRHSQIVQNKENLIKKNISSLKSKITLLNKDIKQIQDKIKLLDEKIKNIKGKIILRENDIKRLENKILATETEIKDLKLEIELLEKTPIYEQSVGTQFAYFSKKQELASKRKEIEDLYLKINSLKSQIQDYNNQIISFQTEKSNFQSQINSQISKIEDLNNQINSLQYQLNEIAPTKVIKEPTVSNSPIKPNIILNIIISAILSLFIGIFLAFFLEWWQKNKEKIVS